MASAAAAIDLAATPKSVDESLWWDSFVLLLNDLENAPLSLELPLSLVKKLKNNHSWFLDTVSLFKPPNQTSRAALDSHKVDVGSHRLIIQPQLKDVALHVSSCLCLDEVQSYILVKQSVERDNMAADLKNQEFVHWILLQYYIERQCLLKCTRQILMHALYIGNVSKDGNAVQEEALKLFADGLERKLLSVLQNLLSSKYPEHMEIDLATLWAEETLIEDSLVLDILFLAYYESFCACNGEQWKNLCLLYKGVLSGSFNFAMLTLSIEARNSLYHAKVQLLLILIETLDLESLLQMVHDEVPFRQGHSVFSLKDVQVMDSVISSFNVLETGEASPLILAWAVFLCLISSLPEKQDNNVLMEIDHAGYVRQAFEAAPLNYFLEILENDILKDSDGPISGYRSVLRTFISAFIASYEITLQIEDDTLKLILDILCKIYHGEESLCVQFWDRDSFIDGPIRCLLCTLEGEFPFRTVELVRFLSALCEGTWPSKCVYNFLEKSVGISTLFEIPGDIENISQIIETYWPLHVPGVEGLLIPSQTHGHILKIIERNTALVRWECAQSGVLVLLLRLAREFYFSRHEEVLVILDLLCRLASFSKAVCFSLLDIGNSSPVQAARTSGHIEESLRVDVVEIICTLVKNLSPDGSGAKLMALSITIMANMLKCSPSHVAVVALKSNILDVALRINSFEENSNVSSGRWCLSGGLARMLLIDCEQNEECCQLTISVLDFTMRLLETGAQDDAVLALVVFCLQYVFVNHEYWKYKLKHFRWKVTIKVLEVMKKCITSIPHLQKLGHVIRNILLSDSSIHNTLFRIMCITTHTVERLYIIRLYELKEIEGLQLAVCSVLDIVSTMLNDLSKDISFSLPVFHQAILSSVTKPIPVVKAVISLISFFRDQAIQVGAARVLSMLCTIADNAQPYLFGNICLASDDMQIMDLRYSISDILCEGTPRNEDLFVAILKLLTSAATFQPAFLVSVIATKENMEDQLSLSGDLKRQAKEASFGSLRPSKASIIDALFQHVKKTDVLIESHPYLLLHVLKFLKALWQGATQYVQILELFKTSDNFWKLLSSSISAVATTSTPLEDLSGVANLSLAYKYECHSVALDIIAHEMYLQEKLQQAEVSAKQSSEPSKERIENTVSKEKSGSASLTDLMDILSTWCKSPVLGNLIKLYATSGFHSKVFLHSKIASSLFIVHVMGKLTTGNSGSLSLSLTEKIRNMYKQLKEQSAFSELLAQYSVRGYSEGKELETLILSDLYYHLEGELEGRTMSPGPFKDLSQYLIESNLLQINEQMDRGDFYSASNCAFLYDLVLLQVDMGLEFWDHSEWKASKPIAERMLSYMQNANSMAFLANSKLSALKALTAMLCVYEENSTEVKRKHIDRGISEQLCESCINHICNDLQRTVKAIDLSSDVSEDILNFVSAQTELLLHLMRSLFRKLSPTVNRQMYVSICKLVSKTSGTVLRVLSDLRTSSTVVKGAMKLVLMLLLTSIKSSYSNSCVREKLDTGSIEAFTEVSLVSLGLLPILCNFIETVEYCTLTIATIDLMLNSFLTSDTWLPIIQKHLRLQFLVQKLQERDSFASIPIILKFLLTLAQVRGGAEMLQNANVFSSLKALFALLLDGNHILNIQGNNGFATSLDKDEKPQYIWGLGLAVVTAMINSLGDSSSCDDMMDGLISYFFCEQFHLVSYYLNAPDFSSDGHDKKRARTQKTQTSLAALKETEHTLMLICMLAKHRNWVKAMKEMDSQLRERCIHLLAFISKGAQRLGEHSSRTSPLMCPPILKEEVESNKKPSFLESRSGWFGLSLLGCATKTEVSDAVAIQIYKIAFLLLEFLCLQVEGAAKRAEEVGYIDLAHFPELPMPEILHGLQDQVVAIVTELCEAHKSKPIQPEIQGVCFLMLQIMEKALYLEFGVSQTCGIRPVLGRVEDFSRGIKLLMQAAETNSFLKTSIKDLKQIISLMYPGVVQAEGFL
ncbi:PREDICTED: uncharacterized protein LOC104600140 [Nelumbo nucifera]|uniref:Uncharacterized protein LOC104600140 n=1 Tax=Nelumbo nucifera TaxID=4432 RepID=A0A1U8A868_NELNU|nr:PREDICTED: uncharacterized protein LOC104600140 [Nelumbo nucifera]